MIEIKLVYVCSECDTENTIDGEIAGEILDGARDGSDEYGDYVEFKCSKCGNIEREHM
jgi:DNA-directed RNA polymerase subunit RPC12/RpoP